MKDFEFVVGIAAGVLTSISMLPQLIKVIREQDVSTISPVMICVLICGVGLWCWYGAMKGELPIMLSNGFSVILNATLLFCYFRFKRNG
ncbi:SemiSWEET transporter [Taibaiella chishuiensis]|uniref:MtN3 and saliva related transmembrane protein n=1 Tax=Taibaiella chishuiensis TaxID=1434707 RepID=A0A2P8CT13_9BACT|nr:SemiSWEET transporter [Taibaiella chishuiensis]PSK88115.1 MtN3 and saliva related transmembrane protein [Taibaiella chishuiensis]